ncbi:hypothetical protein B0H13DRAFT_2146228 [Mycena leptocephala]|nr:hypothetical protein B0H13DRAFT_2146228 [Mycena leptocephala]
MTSGTLTATSRIAWASLGSTLVTPTFCFASPVKRRHPPPTGTSFRLMTSGIRCGSTPSTPTSSFCRASTRFMGHSFPASTSPGRTSP